MVKGHPPGAKKNVGLTVESRILVSKKCSLTRWTLARESRKHHKWDTLDIRWRSGKSFLGVGDLRSDGRQTRIAEGRHDANNNRRVADWQCGQWTYQRLKGV